MTCFSPGQGYASKELTVLGKRKTTTSIRNAHFPYEERTYSCNKCSGCRMAYSREWAVRMVHEMQMHPAGNAFITLTYNDKFLPKTYSEDGKLFTYGDIDYSHWTNFLKRFRKAISPIKIKFYMAPEYGDLNHRPHFHAIIFGYDFPDRTPYMERNGHTLFRSALLEKLWSHPITKETFGYSTIGMATFQSAAYVSRYMLKKVKGIDFDGRYERVNYETGEVFTVRPEKARMSNKPGIGKTWFDKFKWDAYHKDSLHMEGGLVVRPPRYYDRMFESLCPEDFDNIKIARQEAMLKMAHEHTPERLDAKRKCLEANIVLLQRDLIKVQSL